MKNTGHAGQQRIFFILDRATRKYHGDIGLWMQYLDFARKQKANKKLTQILTTVLRLHPTKPALWIYAANHALEEKSDMTEARSFMQRALRFCRSSKNLWLEYAKLEMMYISRTAARSRAIGLPRISNGKINMDGDVQKLPIISATEPDLDVGFDEPIDQGVLSELNDIPALSGAIPMAIYDAAMKQFNDDVIFGQGFFDLVASFHNVPCIAKVLQHVLEGLKAASPSDPLTMTYFIQQPTIGVESASAEFADAIDVALDRFRSSIDMISNFHANKEAARCRSALAHRVIEWMLGYLGANDIDSDIALALRVTLRKTWTRFLADLEVEAGLSADDFMALVDRLQALKLETLAKTAVTTGTRVWPEDNRFHREST